MGKKISFSVSVLLMKEDDFWVAQGLEFDVAAQGKTIQDAKNSFERTFIGQILVDVLNGEEPLSQVPRAPERYWAEFNGGERLRDRQVMPIPESIPPAYMIAPVTAELRVA